MRRYQKPADNETETTSNFLRGPVIWSNRTQPGSAHWRHLAANVFIARDLVLMSFIWCSYTSRGDSARLTQRPVRRVCATLRFVKRVPHLPSFTVYPLQLRGRSSLLPCRYTNAIIHSGKETDRFGVITPHS